MNTAGWIAVGVVAAPLGIWLVARLIFSAYFKSKQDFDTKRKQHG